MNRQITPSNCCRGRSGYGPYSPIGRYGVCSACGFGDGPKPLHVREWACGACGTVHDRDHNAARNCPPRRTPYRRRRTGGDARRLWSAGRTGTRARTAR
ncbi:zinc ribbon domain-containing protein [Streptomyces chartreusis]|uniref:zinc ribbon domain-containing protein n=1 Tax=Streptomyces chartreusis TaxID=1969 RepID=UPI00380319BD